MGRLKLISAEPNAVFSQLGTKLQIQSWYLEIRGPARPQTNGIGNQLPANLGENLFPCLLTFGEISPDP